MKFLFLLIGFTAFTQIEANASSCTYSLVDGTEKVTWTGYKFTEKTGVSGTFDNVKVSHKTANSLEDLLKSISFEIDTKSINSGNPARDMTLQKTVFAFLSVPETIKGEVKAATDKSIDVKMTLNEQMNAAFDYTASEGVIKAEGDIDLTQNGLLKSFKAVAEACKALHTGKDGVSKTWSDVNIQLQASFEEKCSKGIIESVKDWFGS
jgi:hypothetical protein